MHIEAHNRMLHISTDRPNRQYSLLDVSSLDSLLLQFLLFAMDIWKPALRPEFSFWKPSESQVGSEPEVSFWKPSSESEGSIWIPSSESEGTFWKPSFEPQVSFWKPLSSESEEGGSIWKWTPSPESEEGSSIWKWKPSSQSKGSICNPSSESQEPDPSLKYNRTKTWCHRSNSDEPIENVKRRFRRYDAKLFRKEYKFEHGKKTCICSNGIYSLPDNKCYDALWVAVHGLDSICMVTRRKDVDMTRVGSFYQRYCSNQQTLRSLAEAVLSEVECLPYDDEELREKSSKGIEKPFGVVSVIPGTKKVDAESGSEDSSAEYDEEKAIKYLEEKMKTDSACTYNKTIQTTISVFQHLCIEELKAEDIWVTAWNAERTTEHLRLEQRKEHLDVISGVSPCVSGGGSTDRGCPTTDSGRPRTMFEILDSVAAASKNLACPCGGLCTAGKA